jgi:putative toxin-antitoxin system antitoxin component (TIGR02293 family)
MSQATTATIKPTLETTPQRLGVYAQKMRRPPKALKAREAGRAGQAYRLAAQDYSQLVAKATPMQIIDLERSGVQGTLIKDMSRRMEMPSSRLFTILGIPKATAEKKAAAGELVKGSGGQAAVGMMRLLCMAEEIVANSTASQARGFDSAKWLGQWIERPQPALGGRKPADLIDTPTGVELVARLLGALESGAYQ